MSEEQRSIIEILIEKANDAIQNAEKAQKLFIKLAWVFVVSIIASVGTTAGIGWQAVHNQADIEYVRQNAYNRTAAMDLKTTNQAMYKALIGLMKDEDTKTVALEFYNTTNEIINKIDATQSEIVPRSAPSKN
jgi:hypothetical protein